MKQIKLELKENFTQLYIFSTIKSIYCSLKRYKRCSQKYGTNMNTKMMIFLQTWHMSYIFRKSND